MSHLLPAGGSDRPVVPVGSRPHAPSVAIIVPTYNERGNIAPLVAALDRTLGALPYRVVFADDSTDATPEEVRRVAATDARLLLNHAPRRRGLAQAVVDALKDTGDEIVVVMDGDLQHPPAVLPGLLAAVEQGADVAVASRYAPGGRELGLANPMRRLVSWGSTRFASAGLPPARRTSDPLSGFFAFRRAAVDGVALRPVGFKILLEILVRGRVTHVRDVPFTFDRRRHGRSKATAWEGVNFIWHVLRLVLRR